MDTAAQEQEGGEGDAEQIFHGTSSFIYFLNLDFSVFTADKAVVRISLSGKTLSAVADMRTDTGFIGAVDMNGVLGVKIRRGCIFRDAEIHGVEFAQFCCRFDVQINRNGFITRPACRSIDSTDICPFCMFLVPDTAAEAVIEFVCLARRQI